MKKSIIMIFTGWVLFVASTGCTSFETNRLGEQIDVRVELVAEPGNQMVKEASVNCLLGIFT